MSHVKSDKADKLTDTPVETAGVQVTFFQSVNSLEESVRTTTFKIVLRMIQKIMDELKVTTKNKKKHYHLSLMWVNTS